MPTCLGVRRNKLGEPRPVLGRCGADAACVGVVSACSTAAKLCVSRFTATGGVGFGGDDALPRTRRPRPRLLSGSGGLPHRVLPYAWAVVALLVLTTGPSPTAASCVTSPWSEWSDCPCGGGTHTRYREVLSPPVAKSDNSCGSTELTQARECVGDGSSACHAALTCQTLLVEHPATPSGAYWIRGAAEATPFQAYCDMETDGGGWTLVYANSASAAEAHSWDSLVAAPRGIDVVSNDFASPEMVGMISIDAVAGSTSLMVRDVGNWAAGQFSSVHFETPSSLKRFVHHTLVSSPHGECAALPNDESFLFRNSNGAEYSHTQLSDAGGGGGYGWGTCEPPVPADSTPASNVENAPVHWIYHRASSDPGLRVAGVGGSSLGASVIARYFARADVKDVDCQVSPWGAWTSCQPMCGGQRQRWRQVVVPHSGRGKACPSLTAEEACVDTAVCNSGCPACRLAFSATGAAPCHMKAVVDVCFGYFTGSVQCPSHTTQCSPAAAATAVVDRRTCSGCWPGTSGECQQPDTRCVSATVLEDGSRTCPAGSALCAIAGSLPAHPTVVLDMTLWDVTEADFNDAARTTLTTTIATAAGTTADHVVIEAVTFNPAAEGVGILESTVAVDAALVGASIVVEPDASRGSASRVAAGVTTSITSSLFLSLLAADGFSVSRLQLSGGAAVPVDTELYTSTVHAGPAAEAGGVTVTESEVIAMVTGGVMVAAVAAVVAVLARRRAGRRAATSDETTPSILRMPSKPLYLPSSMHRINSFSSTVLGSPALHHNHTMPMNPFDDMVVEEESGGDTTDTDGDMDGLGDVYPSPLTGSIAMGESRAASYPGLSPASAAYLNASLNDSNAALDARSPPGVASHDLDDDDYFYRRSMAHSHSVVGGSASYSPASLTYNPHASGSSVSSHSQSRQSHYGGHHHGAKSTRGRKGGVVRGRGEAHV